jgi:hypothetical protein
VKKKSPLVIFTALTMRLFLLNILLLFSCEFVSQISTSGCTLSGGMSIYSACNNGQGCASGCDLTAYSWFGQQCNGTAFTGNCFSVTGTGGQQSMSTNIVLPAGCIANFTAEFKQRAGACNNAGADGGDKLGINTNSISGTNVYTCIGGVDNGSVNPTGCNGGANADISISGSQNGGNLYIWGNANRSDEIITYTITLSGSCGTNCNAVLPVSLSSLYAKVIDHKIIVYWNVATEKDVDYYSLERSEDGLNFLEITRVKSIVSLAGNSNLSYRATDHTPNSGLNYYRVRNYDNNGTTSVSSTVAIILDNSGSEYLFVNQKNNLLEIFLSEPADYILLFDICGRETMRSEIHQNKSIVAVDGLPPGIYLIGTNTKSILKKVLIY